MIRVLVEMNYDATNPQQPAGEVLLRGPQLFSGYYKQVGVCGGFEAPALSCCADFGMRGIGKGQAYVSKTVLHVVRHSPACVCMRMKSGCACLCCL